MKASANGTLPALARQIMYAARPRIQQLSGKDRLDDKYFTQTLLPDYIAENGCAHWNVVYDARLCGAKAWEKVKHLAAALPM